MLLIELVTPSKLNTMRIKEVFRNNEDWRKKMIEIDADYFKNLSKGQDPNILYIGCSDSRVTAEELMGAKPGEVFVHRNIANVVSAIDMNAQSVINYSVEHLKVKHIVVCGHYGCGGVKSAMDSCDLGLLNPWLRNICDVHRYHKEELNAIKSEKGRYNRLVELNVIEQATNVIKIASVQQAMRKEELKVHGWVFDIETGKLIDLSIDFDKVLREVMKIYYLD